MGGGGQHLFMVIPTPRAPWNDRSMEVGMVTHRRGVPDPQKKRSTHDDENEAGDMLFSSELTIS